MVKSGGYSYVMDLCEFLSWSIFFPICILLSIWSSNDGNHCPCVPLLPLSMLDLKRQSGGVLYHGVIKCVACMASSWILLMLCVLWTFDFIWWWDSSSHHNALIVAEYGRFNVVKYSINLLSLTIASRVEFLHGSSYCRQERDVWRLIELGHIIQTVQRR